MDALQIRQPKDQIADQLRQLIFSGRLEDGVEITQESVAAELGVSRMPVREAFQILELEGLLNRLPNRHMQVAAFSPADIAWMLRIWRLAELEILESLDPQGPGRAAVHTALETFRQTIPLPGPLTHTEDAGEFSRPQPPHARLLPHSGEAAAAEYAFHLAIARAVESRYVAGLPQKLLGAFLLDALTRQTDSAGQRLILLENLIAAVSEHDRGQADRLLTEYYDRIAGNGRSRPESTP